jgi:hypothetical protein
MCFDPVTMGILSFAVGAVQQVASFSAQQQEADAAEKAAHKAYENDTTQLTRRQLQENDAASQKALDISKDEAVKASEVELSASSANVSGVSVGNLLADVHRRASSARVNQFANTHSAVQQLQQEKVGARNTAIGRINASPRPSALGLIAGIAGAGLSAAGDYNKQLQYADAA